MNKRRMITGLLCGLLLAGMLAGCAAKEKEMPAQDTVPPDIKIEEVQTEQTESAVQTEGLPYEVVSTPYGDLYFQDQWTGLMKTEQAQEGDAIVVTFYSEINDLKYSLFHVTIGPGAGTPVGQLTDAEGTKREVFARMNELEDIPELSDSEKNRLYAMQEDLNYVIDNLR